MTTRDNIDDITPEQISAACAVIGSLGGKSKSPALLAARRRNALLGGRKPRAESQRVMEMVVAAIPRAKDGDRAFLIEAFLRLAPEKLYQERWDSNWGRKLPSAERRHLRGWGPDHRSTAGAMAKEILGNRRK